MYFIIYVYIFYNKTFLTFFYSRTNKICQKSTDIGSQCTNKNAREIMYKKRRDIHIGE